MKLSWFQLSDKRMKNEQNIFAAFSRRKRRGGYTRRF